MGEGSGCAPKEQEAGAFPKRRSGKPPLAEAGRCPRASWPSPGWGARGRVGPVCPLPVRREAPARGGAAGGACTPVAGAVVTWPVPERPSRAGATSRPTPVPPGRARFPTRARPSRDVMRRPRLRPRAPLGAAVSQQRRRALCRPHLGALPGDPGRGRRGLQGRGQSDGTAGVVGASLGV